MKTKVFDFLPDEAKAIRTIVFIDEQKFQDEFDDIDGYAKHILLYDDNDNAVGVGRFFTDDDKEYHIGRIAVLKEFRGLGCGKIIIDAIEDYIMSNTDADKIVLSAQLRASEFYTKCGYTKTGDIYLDEYCEHILMYKNI